MAKRDSSFITTGERVGSFVGWAFLISIAVHFFLAPIFPHFAQRHEEQQVEKVSMTKKVTVKVPTPPPPTPTPTPPPPTKSTPPPTHTQPQPKPLKMNVVHTTSKSASGPSQTKYVAPANGSVNGQPGGTGTAPPQPRVATAPPGPPATPKPACKTPYQDATVVQQVSPDYPESARELGLGQVVVSVQVTLSPAGTLIGEKIAQSGGNMSLDQAALSAARQSTYAPKIVNCQPVTGDYLFKVTFDPNT